MREQSIQRPFGLILLVLFWQKQEKNIGNYGKAEREKFEGLKTSISKQLQDIYEQTETYHDGKWLWIPFDDQINADDIVEMLKIKRRPNRK